VTHDALDLRDLVADELAQRRETGYDVTGLEAAVARAPRSDGWPYEEPSGDGTHDRIRRYLELAGAYPLLDYVPALEPAPFTKTYTAERVAYRNLIHGLEPPEAATYRNPYREWIGAQIRADIWGYVSPGRPRQAARLAFQDAALSHTGNGIYGEMWAAALIAGCFVAPDVRSALVASLDHIPPRSRLAEALRHVLDLHASGLDWPEARDQIEARHGHYSWVHTIPNAAIVAAGLLWGAGDYSRTVGLVVQAGWDTDSNGATAGSVYGALHGAAALPRAWVDPLGDLVHSAIAGYDNSRISDLAERTLRLALRPAGQA
jgi:ADP-ribosylglycohydrolase